jgi:hypothetical protein
MKRPERTEREAAALRANLLKRKDQARRRGAAGDTAPAADKAGESSTDLKDEKTPRSLKQ